MRWGGVAWVGGSGGMSCYSISTRSSWLCSPAPLRNGRIDGSFRILPQILSADSFRRFFRRVLSWRLFRRPLCGALIGQDRLIGVGIDLEGVGTRFADRWCWRTHSIDWKLYCPVLRFLVSGSILLSFFLFFLLFHSIPFIFFSISFPYFF